VTLEEVIARSLPATIEYRGTLAVFTIDYLPDNSPSERFRARNGPPFAGMVFGPGGEHTPQDGWQLKNA